MVFGIACATLQLHLAGQDTALAASRRGPAGGAVAGRSGARPDPATACSGWWWRLGTLLVARDLWHAPEEIVSVHLASKIAWPPACPCGCCSWRAACCARPRVLRPAGVRGRRRPARPLASAGQPAPGGRPSRSCSAPRSCSRPGSPTASCPPSPGTSRRSGSTTRSGRLSGGPRALALYRVPASASGRFGPADGVALLEVGSPAALAARFREDPTRLPSSRAPSSPPWTTPSPKRRPDMRCADASSSRFLLLAGRLPEGRADQNPLDELRFRAARAGTPPWDRPRVPVSARYGDAVELYGADYPAGGAPARELSAEPLFPGAESPAGGVQDSSCTSSGRGSSCTATTRPLGRYLPHRTLAPRRPPPRPAPGEGARS